eukprot:CAMPEP_0114565310 /NCGR_PEP_ID=MMETSP0114-20121206/14235_1 /TAXON_ID=31324 /ORGANISM="Goniomonas sp, Strain m" /LENGTH=112 /DNA_ID=CAMNT_0001751535 /DNA_START=128 /DNA_END=467 /DNA_ORIENTATION=+
MGNRDRRTDSSSRTALATLSPSQAVVRLNEKLVEALADAEEKLAQSALLEAPRMNKERAVRFSSPETVDSRVIQSRAQPQYGSRAGRPRTSAHSWVQNIVREAGLDDSQLPR